MAATQAARAVRAGRRAGSRGGPFGTSTAGGTGGTGKTDGPPANTTVSPARRHTVAAGTETPRRQDVRRDRRRDGPAGRHDQEPAVADLQVAARGAGPSVERGGPMNAMTCHEVEAQL